jgi:hypothetical protein
MVRIVKVDDTGINWDGLCLDCHQNLVEPVGRLRPHSFPSNPDSGPRRGVSGFKLD